MVFANLTTERTYKSLCLALGKAVVRQAMGDRDAIGFQIGLRYPFGSVYTGW